MCNHFSFDAFHNKYTVLDFVDKNIKSEPAFKSKLE
jgi:hypothetical protein